MMNIELPPPSYYTGHMRIYVCTGLGKEYTIEANSPAAAKLKAGRQYVEETKNSHPIDFYAQHFEPRVVDPQKPGKKTS